VPGHGLRGADRHAGAGGEAHQKALVVAVELGPVEPVERLQHTDRLAAEVHGDDQSRTGAETLDEHGTDATAHLAEPLGPGRAHDVSGQGIVGWKANPDDVRGHVAGHGRHPQV
jgi:hypothetical protein